MTLLPMMQRGFSVAHRAVHVSRQKSGSGLQKSDAQAYSSFALETNNQRPMQADLPAQAPLQTVSVSSGEPLSASVRPNALERMPKWLICIPLALQWLGLALRYRSLTLPSAANPAITSGGLVGEGKLEYFAGMGPVAREATALYCAVSTACRLPDGQLHTMLRDAGLDFPLIAKPDLGLCGHGVRRIANIGELQAYLTAFPRDETVVLQQYLPQDGEAGIFYARDPLDGESRIIGLTLRYFPQVTGDGHQSLAQLIAADPRACRLVSSRRHQCTHNGHRVPAAGELVRLATVGSTRVGGLYRDGGTHITPELTRAMDAIARDMPLFHFGRFDVRFNTLRELRAGTGFTIMEVNGAGSEAIQAWDPETKLLDGFRMIFAKQRLVFAIGDAMRRTGFKPIGLLALMRLNLRQQRLIAAYPPSN